MERPEHVPQNFIYVTASDGCTYWVHPKCIGNDDYFFPCYKSEDHDTEESWHTGDELKEAQ
jgi:hypothetical protein